MPWLALLCSDFCTWLRSGPMERGAQPTIGTRPAKRYIITTLLAPLVHFTVSSDAFQVPTAAPLLLLLLLPVVLLQMGASMPCATEPFTLSTAQISERWTTSAYSAVSQFSLSYLCAGLALLWWHCRRPGSGSILIQVPHVVT